MREIIHQTLMWSAVAFGLIAAGLWYRASTVVVNTHDPRKAEVTIGGVATQATAEKQAQANKFAAIATAIAVALQLLLCWLQNNFITRWDALWDSSQLYA